MNFISKTLTTMAAWPFPTEKPAEGKTEDISTLKFVHVFNVDNPKGGLTVAFRKSSPHKGGNMVDCAVAVCSKHDTFSKKIGRELAEANFLDGQVVSLPLFNKAKDTSISTQVKNAFLLMFYGYI